MKANDSVPRNIVLVTADSVRADHCGFINPESDLTPTLDGMAADGVTFDQAISPGPRTPASIPEIMTSTPLPNDSIDLEDWQRRLGRVNEHVTAHETLAQRLSKQGYTTLAFSGNPWASRDTAFDRGFDRFYEIGNEDTRDLDVLSGTRLAPLSEYLDQWWNNKGFFARWDRFFQAVTERIKEADEPYFLWLFLMDTHSPYISPRDCREESSLLTMYTSQFRANSIFQSDHISEEYERSTSVSDAAMRNVERAYRDAVRSVDRCVASVWDALEVDDPVVVFHSDHGEAFGEHGTFGHQRELYEENVHVPLLVYNSDSTERVTDIVSLRSLTEMVQGFVTEGITFEDDRWRTDHAVLRTEDNSKVGLRTRDWKYIRSDDDEYLFDLKGDPGEKKNRVADEPERVSELRETVRSFVEGLPSGREGSRQRRQTSDRTKDRLSNLGYIE